MSEVSLDNSSPTNQQDPNPAGTENTPQEGKKVDVQNPSRPDGLSDAFWDNEKNEIKLNDLIADHGNLSKFKTESETRLANRPESPEKYEIRVPESVKLPEGTTFEFDKDSPLMKIARQVAFDSGRGQEGFDEMVSEYINHEITRAAQEETLLQETYQAELAKLGEKGKDRIEAVNSFMKSNLTDKQFEAIKSIATTAEGIRAVETLMSLSKDSTPKRDENGGGEAVTQESLDAIMRDPKYWRDRDPDYMAKVQEGYKKLYPGKIQISH